MPPHGGLNCTVSSCRTSCLLVDIGCLLVEILVSSALPLVENYCLLVENFAFRPVSDVTIGLLAFFFFPEDLLGRFRRLPRDVFVVFWIVPLGPISILWLRRYGRNFLPTLRSDFVIHETLLWCFVFIVFVIFLVTTFIGRLIYFLFPNLRSDFYCILFYNYLFLPTLRLDFLVGHPLGGLIWSIVFFGRSVLSIVFFDRSSCFCSFTACRDSPLPRNRNRTSIK